MFVAIIAILSLFVYFIDFCLPLFLQVCNCIIQQRYGFVKWFDVFLFIFWAFPTVGLLKRPFGYTLIFGYMLLFHSAIPNARCDAPLSVPLVEQGEDLWACTYQISRVVFGNEIAVHLPFAPLGFIII